MTKLLVCYNSKKYPIHVNLNTCTVKQFKSLVFLHCGVAIDQQKIFGWPRKIAKSKTLLSSLGLEEDHLLLLYRTLNPIPNIKKSKFNEDNGTLGVEAVFFENLPGEVQYSVFSLLDVSALLNCALVCKSWNEMSIDDWIWQEFFRKRWPTINEINLPNKNVSYRNLFFEHYSLQKNWINRKFRTYLHGYQDVKSIDYRNKGYLSIDSQFSQSSSNTDSSSSKFVGNPSISSSSTSSSSGTNSAILDDSISSIFSNFYQNQKMDSMIAFSAEETSIFIGNIWNKSVKRRMVGHKDTVLAVRFAGQHHLISSDVSGKLFLWDLHRSPAILPWSTTSSELVGVKQLHRSAIGALSIEGNHVISGHGDGVVSVLDLDRSIYPLLTINKAHSDKINFIDQSNLKLPTNEASSMSSRSGISQHVFATCSLDGFAKVWDLRSGKTAISLFVDSDNVHQCKFGWDNQLLTCGDNGTDIWDLRTCSMILKPTQQYTRSIFYDGSRLLLASDSSIILKELYEMGVPNPDSIAAAIEATNKPVVLEEQDIYKLPLAHTTEMFATPSSLISLSGGRITGLDMAIQPQKKTQTQTKSIFDDDHQIMSEDESEQDFQDEN